MTIDRDVCFYCRKPVLEDRGEQDHAPVPKRHGGETTVTACVPCHDLKDRLPAREWPIELLVQAIEECGPLGRIYLAKAFGTAMDKGITVPVAEPHARSA